MVPLLFPGFLVYVAKFGQVLVVYEKHLQLASTVAGKCWFRLSSGLMMINANDFHPSCTLLGLAVFVQNI